MLFSRRKVKALERRIADLEAEVQSQHINYEVKLSSSNCDTDNLVKKYIEKAKIKSVV